MKMGKSTGMADLSQWELMDSGMTVGNLYETELGPLNVGDNCVAWSGCGTHGSKTYIYPYPWCRYWHFGTHSLWLDINLAQP